MIDKAVFVRIVRHVKAVVKVEIGIIAMAVRSQNEVDKTSEVNSHRDGQVIKGRMTIGAVKSMMRMRMKRISLRKRSKINERMTAMRK